MDYVKLLYSIPYGIMMELLRLNANVYIKLHCVIDDNLYQPFILVPCMDTPIHEMIWMESSIDDKLSFVTKAFFGLTISFKCDSNLADINVNLSNATPYDTIIAKTILHPDSVARVIAVSVCCRDGDVFNDYIQLNEDVATSDFVDMVENYHYYEDIYELIVKSMELTSKKFGGDSDKR